jgi:hypothetical protein
MEVNIMALPYPTNISGIGDLALYTNSVTNNMYGNMFLIAFCLVVFITIKAQYTTDRAFITTTFLGAVVSVMLGTIGFVSSMWPLTLVALTLVGLIYQFIERETPF